MLGADGWNSGADFSPGISGGVVPGAIPEQSVLKCKIAAPDDDFVASPNRCMEFSGRRGQNQRNVCPYVCSDIVTRSAICVSEQSKTAPYHHLGSRPGSSMETPSRRRSIRGQRVPRISDRVVS